MACASLGIVPTVRHADYIGSWLTVLREVSRAVVRAVLGCRLAKGPKLRREIPEDVPGSADIE